MATEFKMPQLGLQMDAGTVVRWYKSEGELVKVGDELLSIETEKLDNAIESPVEGFLLKILAQEGDEMPVGAVLALIGESGEQVSAAPVAVPGIPKETGPAPHERAPQAVATPAAGRRIKISPKAKKLAEKLGVDYTNIQGSDISGRIIAADIERAASVVQTTSIASVPAPAVPAQAAPYAGMRKRIGDNMTKSWTTIPMVTHHVKADVGELLAAREKINASGRGDKVSITDMLVLMVARALKRVPGLNVSLTETGVVTHQGVNMGVAVSVENGLIVPVVKDVDRKGLFEISADSKELIAKARENRLGLNEITGATFTISNLGGYGSVDTFTPIVNSPEAAILGVGRTVKTPCVRDEEIIVRPMMGLSLTYDHRLVDGALAAEFMQEVLTYIENPIAAI